MYCLFALLQLSDQFVDALNGQRIKAHSNEPAVAWDVGFELLALITHGSPRLDGRERVALSVIDRCRNRAMMTPTI
jgi:hypothetical protein